jgi:hypothetical protein
MLLLAATVLGIGLVTSGMLSGLPFVLGSAALLLHALVRGSSLASRTVPWLIAVSVFFALANSPAHGRLLAILAPLTILQAAIAIAAWLRPGLAGRSALGVVLGLYAVGGALWLTRGPPPRIDVFMLEQDGSRDLEHGLDPYRCTFPNFYTKEETRVFFGDERTELREYPYPPLSLLATTVGHRIGGDVRWTLLTAQLGIALLLFALARGAGHDAGVALAIATLHLLHPRGLQVLDLGWTDSMPACAFLAFLWAQQRRMRGLGVVLGLFVGAKQYSLIALPIVFRTGRVQARAWMQALVTAAVTTLPFFLWSPHDFVNDVVLFQLRQPFREDALSIPAFVAWASGWHAPGALAIAGAGAALACAWSRIGPRADPSALPLTTALVYMGFFLFAKQAFCNYYYFVGTIIVAAAALLPPVEVPGADSKVAMTPG